MHMLPFKMLAGEWIVYGAPLVFGPLYCHVLVSFQSSLPLSPCTRCASLHATKFFLFHKTQVI